MEHDSSRSGYHEPEPGLAGLEDEEDWGDDFPQDVLGESDLGAGL